jgi:cellulose synthase/poly-beta-1,6-N-acetylglucosamine synthase-like glycosyltransferase
MPFQPIADLPFFLKIVSLALYAGTASLWARGIFRWAGQRAHRNVNQPSVSVIIAARNEQELIADCLQSVLAQDYPSDLCDVIVVDDHSDDKTSLIAENVASGKSVPVKILTAPLCPVGIGPKKNALAFGISQSSGEILIFTDADCRVSTSWIRSHICLYDDQTGAVAGATFPSRHHGMMKSLRWLERFLVNYTAASAVGWGMPASVNGGNFSYRRTAFDQLGGIAHSDVASGDDDLMAQAIARKGWRVRFAAGKDSVVTEVRRATPKQHWNAAVRHQSTVQYYPGRWRAAFAASIFAAAVFIACLGFAAAGLVSWISFIGLFVIRAAIEIPAAFVFAQRNGFHLSLALTFLGEVLLPFYLILRPLAALAPNFVWHGQTHQPRMANAAGGTR